ncbi:DUF523 and DUF1722 domain-containing protein [Candidatus Woesearchaeota archaeon]|nr:DUF523 and DUF1722 domain-containing protein [Candidatus Woesearchaeota archaeon]
MKHPKPIVVISKCIEFSKCRYNGSMVISHAVQHLKKHVKFVTVCPEQEIGLKTPRHTLRIVKSKGKKRLYQPDTKKDFTKKMQDFTRKYLSNLDVDGFILKYRSPSCGPKQVKVYNGLGKNVKITKGNGFFGGEVLKKFSNLAIEDEGRLRNFIIREHFLTKLFTLARFRKAKKSVKKLKAFHDTHRLLLMAHSQARLKILDKLAEKGDLREYENELKKALENTPKFTSIINVLYNAFGEVSHGLSAKEKKFFLKTVEEYRNGKTPLSTAIHLLKTHAIRFDKKHLLEQVFLEPFPPELAEITDSGKGRDL